jgi:hypothetical protein
VFLRNSAFFGVLVVATVLPAGASPARAADGDTFTVVAAGDIAERCLPTASSCQHKKTYDRAVAIDPAFFITMGDNQYDNARLQDFTKFYDTTWGKLKARTRPTPGNHETYDPAGAEKGYKSYFGAVATPQGNTWYSFDQGNWHFVALDSNYFSDKTQLSWLDNDLAANTKPCVAAYWHHPAFSSGEHGNDPKARNFWDRLYKAKADLVLNGHDHTYERFAPQTPAGKAAADGIVEVVGGTGGANPYEFTNVQPNSKFRLTGKFGVLKLAFGPNSYSWQLVGTDGAVLDTSPTFTCH